MLGIFARKKNEAIDAFARELAGLLARRFTARDNQAPADTKLDRKLGRALDEVYARAREFRAEKRLGVYGKARLGNTFKWALKELEYDEGFIEEVTRGLIVRLSGR